VLILAFVPVRLWVAAWASGAYVGLFTLIGMRLRRIPPNTIVTARISAVKAGLNISVNDLEAHFLAGGNVVPLVNAMISADKANIVLPFQRAAAIDLAGRDVLEAVKMSVLPKVIETPRIAAVAKDGIQLIVLSRVTVRTNIERLVGGAGEETIIARVGEGMVSTIGSSASHKNVLENPDHISKHILSRGLDAGTAYEILSIDIADVDVGANIGAKLQIDQANADKQIAQAKAEERRAMAVALEQEMRAKVVEAEAEVPRAMAEAFRGGNLGIMDYYRMKNVQADTAMRDAIAAPEVDNPPPPRRLTVGWFPIEFLIWGGLFVAMLLLNAVMQRAAQKRLPPQGDAQRPVTNSELPSAAELWRQLGKIRIERPRGLGLWKKPSRRRPVPIPTRWRRRRPSLRRSPHAGRAPPAASSWGRSATCARRSFS
jgi:uncharacterized protein YqfA (UPF0365 family)